MIKRIIATILAVIFSSFFLSSLTLNVAAFSIKGDVNFDNEVDMADAVMIMQALANPNKYGIEGVP